MRKMKMFRKILFAAFVLVTCTVTPVNAQTISDESLIVDSSKSAGDSLLANREQLEKVRKENKGTIEIVLTDGKVGTSKSNVEFICTKIADIKGGEYFLLDKFKDSEVNLQDIKNAAELDAAALKLSKLSSDTKNEKSAVTDSNGTLIFENLDVGVYLLKAIDTDSYDTVNPVLIAIPTWNEEEGMMQYDLTVYPKHEAKAGKIKLGITYAPQTGLNDAVLLYLVLAIGAALIGIKLIVPRNIKRKDTRNEK